MTGKAGRETCKESIENPFSLPVIAILNFGTYSLDLRTCTDTFVALFTAAGSLSLSYDLFSSLFIHSLTLRTCLLRFDWSNAQVTCFQKGSEYLLPPTPFSLFSLWFVICLSPINSTHRPPGNTPQWQNIIALHPNTHANGCSKVSRTNAWHHNLEQHRMKSRS